jgi:hypothetical protein
VQYQAELLDASGNLLAGFRIVHHTADSVWLDPAGAVLPASAAQLRVRSKFFAVFTNGVESPGSAYQGDNGPVPRANVRFGFAFHRDPDPTNIAEGRFPEDPREFVHDLADPDLLDWLAEEAPRYVMWDVLFDLEYKPGQTAPPGLQPSTPLPELRFLRLPFRF